MRKLRNAFFFFVIVVISVSLLASCGGAKNNISEKDTENSEVKSNQSRLDPSYKALERGKSVDVNEDLLTISQKFIPAEKQGGYVSTAQISATISGFDNEFTYFATAVTIIWTYNEISEIHPEGIDKTFSTTIGLDADGNGSYSNQIFFQGCRDVEVIDVTYEFSGTATKK